MRLHEILIPAFAETFSGLSHWKVRNPHSRYKVGTSWTSTFGCNASRNSRRILWSSSFFSFENYQISTETHRWNKSSSTILIRSLDKQSTLQLLYIFFVGCAKCKWFLASMDLQISTTLFKVTIWSSVSRIFWHFESMEMNVVYYIYRT